MTDAAYDPQMHDHAPWQDAVTDLGGRTVLMVEDNLLVAAGAESLFRALGASDVHIANTVGAALEALSNEVFGLAVLDVDLMGETSVPVADACVAQGIPLILVTGYAAADDVLSEFPKAPVCVKPLTEDQLTAAMSRFDRVARIP